MGDISRPLLLRGFSSGGLVLRICGFVLSCLARAGIVSGPRCAVRLIDQSGAAIDTRCSASVIEPGIFGWFRPVLLLPDGIAERLTPEQLSAIVAHEMCHVRRRDNLAAAIHMAVEAVFWFHPLVWWIGARLVEERERACDEEVLRAGSDPQVYAEGILNVCRFYVESPLPCVAGITGADLKKRIEAIMTNQISRQLSFGRKLLLAAAGCTAVAAPVAIGILNAPQIRAQAQKASSIAFEVVSVKPNKATDLRRAQMESLPGGKLTYTNVPLRVILTQAFSLPFQGPERISAAPAWINSERFDIEAKAPEGAIAAGLPEKARNDKMMQMLQTALADRFRLKTHWETRQLQVYSLVVSKDGLKLPKAKMEEKDCPEVSSQAGYCHMVVGGQGQGFHGRTADMSDLVGAMENFTDRPVIDNTGFKGLFDIDTEGWVPMRPRPGPAPGAEPSAEDKAFADPGRPTLPALMHKVGIEMEATRGPVQVLVIDR